MDYIETLKNCINKLGSIQVPIALIDQITIPVCQVRNTLIELVNALANEPKPEVTQEPSGEEEPIKMEGESDEPDRVE